MKKMKLGVILRLNDNIVEEIAKIKKWGFETCQISCFDKNLMTEEYADRINRSAAENEMEITAFWCGLDGPAGWNFYDGPSTLGLVPPAYRFNRIETLKHGADFARKSSVTNIVTQMGFIPENPYDADYIGLINAVKHVAEYCRSSGQNILFETGLDAPITLKRIMQDINMGNVGINFDPANLLMWGKANPIDALCILGGHIMEVHAKDGEYPVDGKSIGVEKPLGLGKVNIPAFISGLKAIGYEGSVTIETYAAGGQWDRDVIAAKKLLEGLIK